VQFETIETLVLLLLFSVPGAIFLYSYSRGFNPYERITFIQEQFPFELAVLYVITSAIIHSCLIVISLILVWVSSWIFNNSLILSDILVSLSDIKTANLSAITVSICTIISYFLLSILIAYWAGKLWAKHNFGRIPYWCKQIIEMRLSAIKRGEKPIVEITMLNGGKMTGAWYSFSLIDRKKTSFEVTIHQVEANQLIWISSSNIQEMSVKTTERNLRLFFGPQDAQKKNENKQN